MTIAAVLKKSDIPAVASYRLSDEDREIIWKLIQLRKPRKLSALFMDALDALLEKEQTKK
jgi:hypothetical protein